MPKLSTSIQTIDLSLTPNKIKDQLRYDPVTGGTLWTLRGTARVCGVSVNSIQPLLKAAISGVRQSTAKYAELLDTLRLQGVRQEWLQDGIPDESVYTILEYYASQPSRTLARANLGYFSRLGIRAASLMALGRVQAVEPPTEEPAQPLLEDSVTALDVQPTQRVTDPTNELLVRLLRAGKSAGLLADSDFHVYVDRYLS